MNEKNTWAWIIGIIVVLLVIGGLWWWVASPAMQPGDMASSTDMAATTTASGTTGSTPAPVASTDTSSESIATIVAGLSNATEYAGFFSNSGVGATLGTNGPYTVFVSTDAGYALLKPGTISNMTAAQQKRMVQYSIISGTAVNVNTQKTGSIKSLSGDEINFKVGTTGLVQINSSYALAAYKASNGIVYVINQPLVPPTSGNILTP